MYNTFFPVSKLATSISLHLPQCIFALFFNFFLYVSFLFESCQREIVYLFFISRGRKRIPNKINYKKNIKILIKQTNIHQNEFNIYFSNIQLCSTIQNDHFMLLFSYFIVIYNDQQWSLDPQYNQCHLQFKLKTKMI